MLNGRERGPDSAVLGTLAGFEVRATIERRFDEVVIEIAEVGAEIRTATDQWRDVDPSTLVQRLERRIQNLDSALADARTEQVASTQEADRARARIGSPFDYEVTLRSLLRRQEEITELLVPPTDRPPSLPAAEPSAAERMHARLATSDGALPRTLSP